MNAARRRVRWVSCAAAGWALLAALTLAPATAPAATPPASLSARAVTLVEETTGQSLYGYAQSRELPIASTTKLMTALITIEHARLNEVFTEPDYYPAPVDSQIGLRPGERMNVHDLLLALLLPSADDAAEDLAYNVGRGSVSRFVAMMNKRAASLGLGHTHYTTPIGLDTPGNHSSASDLVRLAAFLRIYHPFFARAVASSHALLRTGDQPRLVVNRNTLVGRVPWINGVKTGHTLDAGYVLVGSGTRRGMTLISAVLGTPSEGARNADTLSVLDYGFAAFRIVAPVAAGELVARLPVANRPGARAEVIAARSFVRVLPRNARVGTRAELPSQLAGPMPRHARVGTLIVTAGGRTLARIPLLLAHALAAVSPLAIVTRFLLAPLVLVPLALALGLGALAAGGVRVRARGPAKRAGAVVG